MTRKRYRIETCPYATWLAAAEANGLNQPGKTIDDGYSLWDFCEPNYCEEVTFERQWAAARRKALALAPDDAFGQVRIDLQEYVPDPDSPDECCWQDVRTWHLP